MKTAIAAVREVGRILAVFSSTFNPMRFCSRPLLIRLGFAALFCAPWTAQAEVLHGQIVAITDGDTLTLLVDREQRKIRLAAIDSPERVQAFGDRAKSNLGRLAFNRNAVADCHKTDRYGRLICKVQVDGQDVGLAQIAQGFAWWYRTYAKEQAPEDQAAYEQAETMAKLRRHGLWADTRPIPPWEWRREH
ncbi:MAG: thermonuclease family protein [Candidatus Contendobacter sp.]|jgi:endonuclease YncB( thermonuclease family)|nr:thermonuclease family protein [Candidatus Contendobacter sp.]